MGSRRFAYILAGTVPAFLLVACGTTSDPFTGEESTSKTSRGAIIGAVGGAVAGIISGDDARERRQRALVGAGIGAIAGGAVGNYMDRQEAELRDRLENTGVSVTRHGDHLTLNMPGHITFDLDSPGLKADFFPVLDAVVEVLGEYEKTLIEIVGHTDSTGSDAHNQDLSERRARAVAKYLESRGIVPERIAASGRGEQFPIADNATREGRMLNRRVELTLVPITEDG